MAEFRIETFARADAAFRLRSRFADTAVASAANDAWVVVFDGDAHVDRLALDPFSLDGQLGLPVSHNAVLGVIVTGNLNVDGVVLNTKADGGPFLLVGGSLSASDLVIAGSEIAVDGDLIIARTVFGDAGGGRIQVTGRTRAEVIIAGDHTIQLDGPVSASVAQTGPAFRVADPTEVKVAYWIGPVGDADGNPIRGLGSEGDAHHRQLDPDIFAWDAWEGMTTDDLGEGETELAYIRLDRARVLDAIQSGQSVLRGNKRWPVTIAAPFPVSLDVMGTGRVAKPARRATPSKPRTKPSKAKSRASTAKAKAKGTTTPTSPAKTKRKATTPKAARSARSKAKPARKRAIRKHAKRPQSRR
ncbi:MAG: hypothetical protein AB7O24_18735 [Kofleriaceae bacterium]